MEQLTGLVSRFSRVMDRIAGFCMVAVMVLVVANILLRVLFNRPILGTYDYVVLLNAVMIGLALAYCAVQNGHIAVGFLVDRLPSRAQAAIDIVMNIAALVFWVLCAWQVAGYAGMMAASGVVSPTSQIPVFPFIYLLALGILALSLVLLARTAQSIMKAVMKT